VIRNRNIFSQQWAARAYLKLHRLKTTLRCDAVVVFSVIRALRLWIDWLINWLTDEHEATKPYELYNQSSAAQHPQSVNLVVFQFRHPHDCRTTELRGWSDKHISRSASAEDGSVHGAERSTRRRAAGCSAHHWWRTRQLPRDHPRGLLRHPLSLCSFSLRYFTDYFSSLVDARVCVRKITFNLNDLRLKHLACWLPWPVKVVWMSSSWVCGSYDDEWFRFGQGHGDAH